MARALNHAWSFWTLAIAVAGAAAMLPAQLRHPCLGTVVDADGKPLAEAAVTLVWTPGSGRPGALDIVRTTTDARGRFRANLVASHAYSAWAVGPAGPDGVSLVSEVTDRAVAGVVLELAAWHRGAPRKLQCTGFESWCADGAVRLRWYCDGRHDFGVDLLPTPDGKGVLPPGPWATGTLALIDAKGRIEQLHDVGPETPEPTIELHPPHESELHVVDTQNRPIAGAVVEQMLRQYGTSGDALFRQSVGDRWRFAGSSDDTGRARLRMVRDSPRPTGWLRVDAGGVRRYVVDTSVTKAKELRVVVPEIQAQPGIVRGMRDGEIAFAQVSTCAEFDTGNGVHILEMQLPLTVSDGGRLGIAPTPVTCRGSSLLMQLIPQREGIARHLLADRPEPAERLPTLDLDEFRTWHVRAVDADNNPLPGASVKVIGTSEPRLRTTIASMELVLDHAGRADLLLDESEWGVYVTVGTEHALEFVAAGRDGGDLLMRLEPLPTARIRVVDANGEPMAHARIEVRGGSPILDQVRRDTLKKELGALITSTTANGVRSDTGGMMTVPVQDWTRLPMKAWVHAGDLVSQRFQPVAGDRVVDIVVR